MIATGNINGINQFIEIIGSDSKHLFFKNIFFKSDLNNITPFEYCLFTKNISNKYKLIKHLFLIFDEFIMDELINNINALYRILVWILNEKENLMKVLNYSYTNKPKTTDSVTYNDKALITVALRGSNNICVCKKIIFIIGDDEFVNKLFVIDQLNINCIEYVIWKSKGLNAIKFIFGIKQLKEAVLNNNELLFRIVYLLFSKYNKDKFEYIQNVLSFNDEIYRKLLVYKSPQPTEEKVKTFSRKARTYWDKSLVFACIMSGQMDKIKYFPQLDVNIFIKEIFNSNENNLNAVEYIIKNKKYNILKYILSMGEIKIILNKNKNILFRILYWMFHRYDVLINELKIDDKIIISFLNYKIKKPENINYFSDNYYTYWSYNFVNASISNSLFSINKLIEYIGKDLFVKKLFDKDQFNVNSLEFASVGKYKIFEFVINLPNENYCIDYYVIVVDMVMINVIN